MLWFPLLPLTTPPRVSRGVKGRCLMRMPADPRTVGPSEPVALRVPASALSFIQATGPRAPRQPFPFQFESSDLEPRFICNDIADPTGPLPPCSTHHVAARAPGRVQRSARCADRSTPQLVAVTLADPTAPRGRSPDGTLMKAHGAPLTKKMLINAQRAEELRVSIIEDGRLENYQTEVAESGLVRGNIYRGVVANVEPSLNAAFIDFGAERHGFLAAHDIVEQAYHKKGADAGRPRIDQLLQRGRTILVQVTKDAIGTKGATLTTNLSLAGRYLVLTPFDPSRGVSRKVEDDAIRVNLLTRVGGVLDLAKIESGNLNIAYAPSPLRKYCRASAISCASAPRPRGWNIVSSSIPRCRRVSTPTRCACARSCSPA